MSSLGKLMHLRRMQNTLSGKIFTVALDHASSYGILDGLQDIQSMIDLVAKCKPEAMLLMPGTAQKCFQAYAGEIALILKCSTLSPHHPQHDVLVRTAEDAARLGADAIAMAVTVGSAHQAQVLANLSLLIKEAEHLGMPVIVHAYPNGENIPPDERYSVAQVSYASRLMMECGVDIIKTFYTGSAESFSLVVDVSKPALVVAAGGARLESEVEVLQMVYNVTESGAAGVTIGRNIWQSKNIPAMIQAIKAIVHENQSVETANQILQKAS